MKPTDICYGQDGDEILDSELHETVERVLDRMYPHPLPRRIEVLEWKRREVSRTMCSGDLIEHVLERLDEEYGGEDYTEPKSMPEAVRIAEQAFLDIISSVYVSWQCEPNGITHTIDCLEWVTEHQPDWLQGKEPVTFEEPEHVCAYRENVECRCWVALSNGVNCPYAPDTEKQGAPV